MIPPPGNPDKRPNRKRNLGLVLALLLAVTGIGWVTFGPHRRLPALLLEEAARHGWQVQGGNRQAGPLSTTLQNLQVLLHDDARLSIEVGRVNIKHWPWSTPRVSIEDVRVHLSGDPLGHFEAVAKAWFAPEVQLAHGPMEVIYQHRLLGKLRLAGVALERRGDGFEIAAAQVTLGDVVWRDVRLSLERRKKTVVIGFGAQANQGPRLTCFPSNGEGARWLVDLPHGPLQPLLRQLGLQVGDEFAATQGAGSLSLDIPNDGAQPVRGRVQVVVDNWPLYAPAGTEPLLGQTFSLLSNLVASTDNSHWELPRAELTMPVFSLVGKGSLRLGREKRLLLEAEGERTCPLLRGLLPPSRALDDVRKFLERKGSAASKDVAQSARLEIRWDTANPAGLFRPTLRLVPGCGLEL